MTPEQNTKAIDRKQIEAMTPAERFELLSKAVSRHSPNDVKTILEYDIAADAATKETMLFTEYLNKRYRNFELLAKDPRFQSGGEDLMSHVMAKAPHSTHAALLYEQGFRLARDEQSGTFWEMGKRKDVAFIKLIEQYQPELFKDHFAAIATGAPQNENPDICAYLLENYMHRIDYEIMIEMAVKRNNAGCFKLLFDRYDEANDLDLRCWEDLTSSLEDARVLRELAAQTNGNGCDIFSLEGLIQMVADADAHECLEYIFKKHQPDQDMASRCLKTHVEKSYRRDCLSETIELLLGYGADPGYGDGEILINAAKGGDAHLLSLFVEHDVDLLPYATKLYEAAIDYNNSQAITYFNKQRLSFKVQEPKKILERVLNSRTSAKRELIETLEAVVAAPDFQDDQTILRFLIDNLDASGWPDLISSAAQNVKTPVLDEEFLDHILQHPEWPNNWIILGDFLERGLDFSDRQDTAGRLLAAAITGNSRYVAGLLMEDLKVDVHVDGEKPLIAALLRSDDKIFNELIEDFNARVTDLDWHYWCQAQSDWWGLEITSHHELFEKLAPHLERERQEARSVFEDTRTLTKLSKSDWLKPSQTLGLSPLQAATRLNDFIPLLKTAERKSGLRFSAEELLAKDQNGKSAFDRVVGFGYYKEFFDPEYWGKDVKGMQKLFDALPKPFQDEVGQTVIDQARVKHALIGVNRKSLRPRLRRRPS
jgi:hypothetical protein